MSGTNTQACMGGFCEQRGQCADYLQADRLAQEPSQRKCHRGQEVPVVLHGPARGRILAALTAAGSDGVAYVDLLRLAGAKAIAKALIAGRKEGLWCSNRRRNNLTRYYTNPADMLAAAQASRQEARAAKRAKDDARAKAKRAAKRQAKPAAPRPRAEPEAKPVTQRPVAAVAAPKLATKPQAPTPAPEPRPVVIPPGLCVHRTPTPPSRYAVSRVEPIFSGLPVGMYHPAESALARAYAQGGAL
jgi:hypothetical protein